MTALASRLKSRLSELVRQRRVVVWYDPGATLERCLHDALPDGAQLHVHEGSSLALRVAFEEANWKLERAAIIYIEREPEEPSWLRDLELAGCRCQMGLKDLIADGFDVRLEHKLKRQLVGPAAAELAAAWDDLIGAEAPTATDLRRGLIGAAFGLRHRPSLEDLVLEFLGLDIAAGRLPLRDLLTELQGLLRCEMGLPSGSGGAITRQAVAAALLLSEAWRAGGIRLDGLDQVLPPEPKRAQWAAWAAKWRQLDPRSFEQLAAEVENTYSVRSRLEGASAAAIQSFRSVDEAVLDAIEKMVAAGDLEGALEPAKARATAYWAKAARDAGAPHPWDAVIAALEVRLAAPAAGKELAERGSWVLPDLLERYSDSDGGWWRIDDAFRRLDAHRNRLAQPLASSLGEAAARVYVDWVDALAAASATCLIDSDWAADGWKRQGAITSEAAAKQGRIAVVLADALRFDLAMSLAEKLEERGLRLGRSRSLAALPSVTQVGMAAILGQAKPEAEIREGRLYPQVEGAVLTGRPQRLSAFQKRFPNSAAVELDNVRSGRWKPKKGGKAETLIVYMQDLDEQGDFLPQVGSDHFEALVKEIAEGVDALTRAGYSSVLVIPDHGFLLLPEDVPPRTLPAKVGADTARARRYLVGRPAEVEGTVRTSLDRLGWNSTAMAAFPIGAAVFGIPGEPSRYMHGGPTLQETALLTLLAERVSTAAPVSVRIVQPKHIDTIRPRFVLEGDPDGRLLTEPRRVRVIVRSEGKVVGESEVVTVTAGESVEARLGLQSYGSSVEVAIEDFATREVLVTQHFTVALPAGYEEL